MSDEQIDFLAVGPISWDTTVFLGHVALAGLEEIAFVDNGTRDEVGGAVSNAALAARMEAQHVHIYGVTGRDQFGSLALDSLSNKGVDTTAVQRALMETPRNVVLVRDDGSRSMISDPKDLAQLQYSDLNSFRHLVKRAVVAFFSIAEFCQPLVVAAKAAGVVTVSDLQVVRTLSHYHRERLRSSAIVFASGAKLEKPPEEFIREVLACGPSVVVVTFGQRGVIVGSKDDSAIRSYSAIEPTEVVDTRGAGDCFAAIVSVSLSRGLSLRESLVKGLVFASQIIGVRGVDISRLSAANLQRLYESAITSR